MKKLIILLSVLILSACVTSTPQTVRKNTELKENKGIMLVNFSCGSALKMVSIYETGKEWSKLWGVSKRTAHLDCINGFHSLELPEGKYYISSFLGKAFLHIPEKDAYKFTISANKINYIGDIDLATHFASRTNYGSRSEMTYSLNPKVSDNTKTAIEYLKLNMPELYSRYGFSANMAYQ